MGDRFLSPEVLLMRDRALFARSLELTASRSPGRRGVLDELSGITSWSKIRTATHVIRGAVQDLGLQCPDPEQHSAPAWKRIVHEAARREEADVRRREFANLTSLALWREVAGPELDMSWAFLRRAY